MGRGGEPATGVTAVVASGGTYGSISATASPPAPTVPIVPAHTPALHMSFEVLASPSSHGVPYGAFDSAEQVPSSWHSPATAHVDDAGGQVTSAHESVGVPAHTPALHMSLKVLESPSSHGVPFGAFVSAAQVPSSWHSPATAHVDDAGGHVTPAHESEGVPDNPQ